MVGDEHVQVKHLVGHFMISDETYQVTTPLRSPTSCRCQGQSPGSSSLPTTTGV